jgi:hypothetical protein
MASRQQVPQTVPKGHSEAMPSVCLVLTLGPRPPALMFPEKSTEPSQVWGILLGAGIARL